MYFIASARGARRLRLIRAPVNTRRSTPSLAHVPAGSAFQRAALRRRRGILAARLSRAVRPVTDVGAVERRVTRAALQRHAESVREQHRLLEPHEVVADPWADQHDRDHADGADAEHRSAAREPRGPSTSGRAIAGHRIRSSARPSTATRARRRAARCGVRRLLPKPLDHEHRQHDRECGGRLRQQCGVVEPEVRIGRGQHGCDQAPRSPASRRPSRPINPTVAAPEHARRQPVPQRALQPDDRPRRQVRHVQRRVRRARECTPESW